MRGLGGRARNFESRESQEKSIRLLIDDQDKENAVYNINDWFSKNISNFTYHCTHIIEDSAKNQAPGCVNAAGKARQMWSELQSRTPLKFLAQFIMHTKHGNFMLSNENVTCL